MLSVKTVIASLATFAALNYMLCVLFGLLLPDVHMEDFLEMTLPGFRWLTPVTFLIGLVETALYGGYVGALFTVIYNFFVRRFEAVDAETF